MVHHEARPIGVTLIAILLALNGIVVLIGGVAAFGVPGGTLAGIIAIVFGLALLYLAYGMWTLQGWAWLTTLIIEGLNALFALISIISAPSAIAAWISLVLAAVIIIYLLEPHVRADFEQRRIRL